MQTKDTTEEMHFIGHYRNSPTLQIFFTKEDAGRSDFESFSVYNCHGLWIGAYKKVDGALVDSTGPHWSCED